MKRQDPTMHGANSEARKNERPGLSLIEPGFVSCRLRMEEADWTAFAGESAASLGVDAGARVQTPTRLAPFVGVGGSAGILLQDAVPLTIDGATDSEDWSYSLADDESDTIGGLAALYPEVGVHFWFDGQVRLTVFGRFLITTEGREFDDWLIGGQIAIFGR